VGNQNNTIAIVPIDIWHSSKNEKKLSIKYPIVKHNGGDCRIRTLVAMYRFLSDWYYERVNSLK
jgi:hypothetical protein